MLQQHAQSLGASDFLRGLGKNIFVEETLFGKCAKKATLIVRQGVIARLFVGAAQQCLP